MLDAWIGDACALLILAASAFMWSRGWVPRLSESPSIELPELDEVQVRYATRYRLRFALFVLVPVLLVAYFAARIVMVGPEPVAGPDTGQFLGWATAIVTTSTSAGLVARLMSEERLARTHPPLADAVPPLGRGAPHPSLTPPPPGAAPLVTRPPPGGTAGPPGRAAGPRAPRRDDR